MISRLRSPRNVVTGALTLVLSVLPFTLSAQRPAPPQRGGTPRSDTPQLVVSAFSSVDPTLGVQAADAIRRRIQSEHSATDLYVVPRPTIEQTLRSSGYNPDSALAPADLWALAKQVRGDYALAGTVERTSSGVRTFFRLLTQRGKEIVAEPLTPMVGADFGDIAKQVDRAVSDAIRALVFYQDCMNALRMGDYPKAIAAAQQGLRLRPTSVALNVCVLNTLNATHASADSIIAVAALITSVDSTSTIAWANLADARAQKGDSIGALGATRMAHSLEPTTLALTLSLVDHLVKVGQSDQALALLDTALRATPTNAELLRKQWALEFRLGHGVETLASGEALVAADSSAATEAFYGRQLAAAKLAHDSVSAHRLAVQGSTRFPKNVDFLLLLARDAVDHSLQREALGFVNRALAIEPANSIAWQLAISAYARAGSVDSAVATARRALTAGVPTDAVGGSLVVVVTPALSAARTSQKRADWEAVLGVAQAVDSVTSSPQSNYYVGAAAFQIASDELQSLSELAKRRTPTRAERATACSSATRLDGLLRIVAISMPRGGSVDPATASQILRTVPGYSEFAGAMKRANCR